MPATAVFQPTADSFGDFRLAHATGPVLSPQAEARKAARTHFLMSAGFVAGLIAFLGGLAALDGALFPVEHLTPHETALYLTAYD